MSRLSAYTQQQSTLQFWAAKKIISSTYFGPLPLPYPLCNFSSSSSFAFSFRLVASLVGFALAMPLTRRARALPALENAVDVYWSDCERYFRGKLVEKVKEPFTYRIEYDDGDVQVTDMNKVRWHKVRGKYDGMGCCDRNQEMLRPGDYKKGDLKKIIEGVEIGRGGRMKERKREKNIDKRRGKRRKKMNKEESGPSVIREEEKSQGKGGKDTDTVMKMETSTEGIRCNKDGATKSGSSSNLARELTHPAKLPWKKTFVRDYMWVDEKDEDSFRF